MAYAPVEELQRLLGKTSPTAAELDGMNRVLEAAAADIDWSLGYSETNPAPSPAHPIVVDVNLDRAQELWRLNLSAAGTILVGPDSTPVFPARDTWWKYDLRLRPLWSSFGIA